MAIAVGSGANLTCSFGTTPSALTVPPTAKVTADQVPMATILDHKPNLNIAPFGMCTTLTNPQVASATAAAQGALTPQPCLPITAAPWTPGSPTVSVGGQPALTNSSTCLCQWGGTITIANPAVRTSQVP